MSDKPLDIVVREQMDTVPVRGSESKAELLAAYHCVLERVSRDPELVSAIDTILTRRAQYPASRLLQHDDVWRTPWEGPRLQGLRAGIQIARDSLASPDAIAQAITSLTETETNEDV